jgi:hypothetical protein
VVREDEVARCIQLKNHVVAGLQRGPFVHTLIVIP